jgi:mRNA-degrading endonuclease RelE of RelBE toxin-antitoxin system
MSFEIVVTDPFERKLKRLVKKYKSLKSDLLKLVEELESDPIIGDPIGKNCYKIRLAITSKRKGKSGGARVITFVRVTKKTVFLIDIYDKSEISTITDKELKLLISLLES